MSTRTLRAADLPVVHAINQAEVPAVGSASLDQLRRITDMSLIALAAVDRPQPDAAEEVAGFCLVLAPGTAYESGNYRWFSDRYADFVYLDRVAIAPAFRRRGIGRLLYAEVERRAVAQRPSAPWFALEVNLEPRNDASLDFHRELGFVEVGQRTSTDGMVVSLMTKSLHPIG